MNQVRLQGHILVPEPDLAAVLGELPMHVDLTRKEAGCPVFEVSRNDSESNRFNVCDAFVDETAFASHPQRVRGSTREAVTKNVERFYQISGLDDRYRQSFTGACL